MKKLKRAVIKEELVAITGNYKLAILLNQMLYWTERVGPKRYNLWLEEESSREPGNTENLEGGWIYKSANQMIEEVMLDVTPVTARNWIKKLKEMGYLMERENPNSKWDNTIQYRINAINIIKSLEKEGYNLQGYKFDKLLRSLKLETLNNLGSRQNNLGSTLNNLGTLPEITTENTTEITNNSCAADNSQQHEKAETNPSPPYKKIIQKLNKKADRNYSAETKHTRKLIKKLYSAGYGLEDIIEVIEKKVEEWEGTRYAKYLRPKTLFKLENFEDYLNQPWFNGEEENEGDNKLSDIEYLEQKGWN